MKAFTFTCTTILTLLTLVTLSQGDYVTAFCLAFGSVAGMMACLMEYYNG